jgi:hypothetical protein
MSTSNVSTYSDTKKHRHLVLTEDGKSYFVLLNDTAGGCYKQLQTLVGGYIEEYRTRAVVDGFTMYCNEDGMGLELKPNPFYPKVAGPIVITMTVEGETVGWSEEWTEESILGLLKK